LSQIDFLFQENIRAIDLNKGETRPPELLQSFGQKLA